MERSASGTIPTGTVTQTYSIAVSYSTVPFDDSGFNLNMSQSDPEPLTVGDTYELTVGVPNAGWSGRYAHTSGSGYTWSTEFEVSAISLSDATISLSYTSCTCNGSARKPTVTVKYSGKATVTIKGTGNYKGTVKKPLRLSRSRHPSPG